VLQSVAACCSVLQCIAVCCSVLQCVTVCCSVLQCVAADYTNPLQHQVLQRIGVVETSRCCLCRVHVSVWACEVRSCPPNCLVETNTHTHTHTGTVLTHTHTHTRTHAHTHTHTTMPQRAHYSHTLCTQALHTRMHAHALLWKGFLQDACQRHYRSPNHRSLLRHYRSLNHRSLLQKSPIKETTFAKET